MRFLKLRSLTDKRVIRRSPPSTTSLALITGSRSGCETLAMLESDYYELPEWDSIRPACNDGSQRDCGSLRLGLFGTVWPDAQPA
jgi:hypothetical protein